MRQSAACLCMSCWPVVFLQRYNLSCIRRSQPFHSVASQEKKWAADSRAVYVGTNAILLTFDSFMAWMGLCKKDDCQNCMWRHFRFESMPVTIARWEIRDFLFDSRTHTTRGLQAAAGLSPVWLPVPATGFAERLCRLIICYPKSRGRFLSPLRPFRACLGSYCLLHQTHFWMKLIF